MERYELYERAVQSVEHDLALIERAFARVAERPAETLREDFAGTAWLSRAWVESDPDRRATAVDLDAEVLAYAAARRGELLEEEASRLTLVRRDVRTPSEPFDVIVAMNYSWAVLDDGALRTYLQRARRALEPDGALLLEHFGGATWTTPGVDEHQEDGFVYRFVRERFEDGVLTASLHFEEPDAGHALAAPFRYHFHVRSLPRIQQLATEAGFARHEVWLEDRLGRYRRVRGAPRGERVRAVVVLGDA